MLYAITGDPALDRDSESLRLAEKVIEDVLTESKPISPTLSDWFFVAVTEAIAQWQMVHISSGSNPFPKRDDDGVDASPKSTDPGCDEESQAARTESQVESQGLDF